MREFALSRSLQMLVKPLVCRCKLKYFELPANAVQYEFGHMAT